ncbi:transcriptional repressor [Chelatococcus sp. SYSU_G07232]|uniref:Transcriptional repressor n=1 Tax=Chelatococcus albus TaxID=3047466 RepID=A0ABT7ADN1_9HYPH|nr:transcriptional repressor [Chelatococcus sp. SYSU_G07232]MDJ1157484.1 transcriptional repressor [Chelatococcus sp. SYSU_G07232]
MRASSEQPGHADRDHAHDAHGSCAHAATRAAEAPDAIAAVAEVCRERGIRLTPIRRHVLEALYATHRPLGAYDLAELLAEKDERRVAPITVYRALEFLLGHGFVHKLETKNAFVACPHGHAPGELVVFLICESCGGVDEACSPEVGGALTQVLDKARFAPRTQVVEIAGLCAHCRPQAGRAGRGDASRLTDAAGRRS